MRIAVVVAFCIAALLATAQQPGQFGEVLEVSLTNVDVVVTGKDGQPVTGLKPSDFEIYEDGKLQDITHFAELGSGGGSAFLIDEGGTPQEIATPQAPRKFIFYIDDSSLTLDNRRTIFPAVRSFLAGQLRAGDQAMLVTWNRELKVRLQWTPDLEAVNATLATLEAEVSGAGHVQAEKTRAVRLLAKMAQEANEPGSNLQPNWFELENAVRSYAEAYTIDLNHSTNALARMLTSLAGVDGKKVLVVATDSLPTIAGMDLFENLENIRRAAMNSTSSSLRAGAYASSLLTNLNRYNVQPALDTLARAANATRVTVYGINPKGLGGPASGKTEQQMPSAMNVEFAASDEKLAGIGILANRTGGIAMVGAPADRALERIGRDLDAYYSLGYRSTPGSVAERKVEVRTKRPGLQARARSNVFYRTLEREMADRVIANHLQSTPANELGIALEADALVSDGLRPILPVRVIIPINMLTLIPDGKGNMTGGFSVFTCSGDGSGDASGVNVQSHALNFTAEQAAQMKERRINFKIQVPLEKGRRQVSIGVLDHMSQGQGFAKLKSSR